MSREKELYDEWKQSNSPVRFQRWLAERIEALEKRYPSNELANPFPKEIATHTDAELWEQFQSETPVVWRGSYPVSGYVFWLQHRLRLVEYNRGLHRNANYAAQSLLRRVMDCRESGTATLPVTLADQIRHFIVMGIFPVEKEGKDGS